MRNLNLLLDAAQNFNLIEAQYYFFMYFGLTVASLFTANGILQVFGASEKIRSKVMSVLIFIGVGFGLANVTMKLINASNQVTSITNVILVLVFAVLFGLGLFEFGDEEDKSEKYL